MAIRVLQVDDDPACARLVRAMLGHAAPGAFALTHVTHLSQAISCVESDDVDVVLLDLSLPDADGLHGLSMLHAAAPHVPIAIMSANSDESLAVQGVQEGAQDYLVKGLFSGDVVARTLRYAIERQRTQDRLTYMAFHDALTGLPNRALFTDRLRQALMLAERQGRCVAVLFLDLDGFKAVNDTLGHDAGDELLREVARRLVGCTRKSDTIARLAGDEFTAIMPNLDVPNLDGRADAAAVAERILDAVGAGYTIQGRAVTVTTSIGISLYPLNGVNPETLVKEADLAMYRAKQQGKNAYIFGEGRPAVDVRAGHVA